MKSPRGSYFPYYYKGGEIHCLKYGSMYKNHKELYNIMKLEEQFIYQTNKKLSIWVDLYKTNISEDVLRELVINISNLRGNIKKVSFVGLTIINQWRLKRKLMKTGFTKPFTFYADPEVAKTWLVSEKM